MCGIVGYIGYNEAEKILIDGLKRLEYRGYDSAGVALAERGGTRVVKTKGRIDVLEKKLEGLETDAVCGIGHTRWATHGEPSDRNSHPHTSCDGRVTLVHNGIIENYAALKNELAAEDVSFLSETDTEAAVNLIAKYYAGDPEAALRAAMQRLRGSFAFALIFDGYPDTLFALKKDSPLIIGVGKGENFIASDIPAILKWTRDYIVLGEGELARITKDKITVTDRHGAELEHSVDRVDWSVGAAEKDGYPHFMLKEICEQPKALRDTISPRLTADGVSFESEGFTRELAKKAEKIHIVACGSALHAGLIGKTLIEKLSGIPVECDIASEFRYRDPIIGKNDIVMLISQSGETADTLAALRLAKERGALTLAVVNVVGSTIAREADIPLYTHAGPEIAVATTKAYSSQVAMMELLALYIAGARGKTEHDGVHLAAELGRLPELVGRLLPMRAELTELAERIFGCAHVFFIGRGLDYNVAQEGSLKLKEISYIHSEAYAAGELKHGTISLIAPGTPVVCIATQQKIYDKTVSNIREVKARGAYVVLITRAGGYSAGDAFADYVIELPETEDIFLPSLVAVVCQMLAYNIADTMGCDIDKPRNLAKSVTVE